MDSLSAEEILFVFGEQETKEQRRARELNEFRQQLRADASRRPQPPTPTTTTATVYDNPQKRLRVEVDQMQRVQRSCFDRTDFPQALFGHLCDFLDPHDIRNFGACSSKRLRQWVLPTLRFRHVRAAFHEHSIYRQVRDGDARCRRLRRSATREPLPMCGHGVRDAGACYRLQRRACFEYLLLDRRFEICRGLLPPRSHVAWEPIFPPLLLSLNAGTHRTVMCAIPQVRAASIGLVEVSAMQLDYVRYLFPEAVEVEIFRPNESTLPGLSQAELVAWVQKNRAIPSNSFASQRFILHSATASDRVDI